MCHTSRMGYFSADQSNRLECSRCCKVIIHAFCPPQIGHQIRVRSSASIIQLYSCIASLLLNDLCCIQKLVSLPKPSFPSVIGIILQCYWRWIFFSAIFCRDGGASLDVWHRNYYRISPCGHLWDMQTMHACAWCPFVTYSMCNGLHTVAGWGPCLVLPFSTPRYSGVLLKASFHLPMIITHQLRTNYSFTSKTMHRYEHFERYRSR